MLTVDTPVAGARLRDVRNGLTIPPALRARTVADMARHPSWWLNLLTTEPLRFASLDNTGGGTVAEFVNRIFDPAITYDDLAWLRETWTGPLVVKGVQTGADARAIVDRGADAIVVSNHGGRQRRSSSSRRSPPRSATVRSSTSTAGSSAAPTWSPRSPWGRAGAWSRAPISMG